MKQIHLDILRNAGMPADVHHILHRPYCFEFDATHGRIIVSGQILNVSTSSTRKGDILWLTVSSDRTPSRKHVNIFKHDDRWFMRLNTGPKIPGKFYFS